MMTAEDLRRRRLKRRRMYLSILLMLILGVAGFFGGRPARNAIKGWQSRRHAEKGFAFMAQEKWTEARNEVTAAYQLRPHEPQALRAVATFLTRTRQREALDFWQQLAKIDKLTPDDLQGQATIALIAGETEQAEAAVRSLRERADAGPGDWMLDAQLSIQKGEVDNAFALLAKVLADPRATETQQFQAALLERSVAAGIEGAGDRVKDAWSHLEKLAQGKSETALNALVVLAQRELESKKAKGEGTEERGQKSEDKGQRRDVELARALESHPLAKAPHKLLALDLSEHVDLAAESPGAQRTANIDKAIAQWKDAEPSQLLALATWLNGKGEYERELDAIPLEKALQTRELFLQRMDALGALNRWIDIKQLLESERYPLDPVVTKMYLARCNAQLGEKTAAENNWKRALEEAGGDPAKLLTFAEYAEKNGNLPMAEAAYSSAIAQSPKLRIAYQGKLRVAQASGETKKIHDVLAEMLKAWPNDAAIQNDEAYTRLLLMQPSREVKSETAKVEDGASTSQPLNHSTAEELKGIVDLAENLVQRNPRSLPHRTLLALARLKSSRAAEALDVYRDIQVSPAALTPSALAVHAAVLAANEKSEAAKSEAGQIRRSALLPEERALVPEFPGGTDQ
jgi:Tfp pilus assembly protein PilF